MTQLFGAAIASRAASFLAQTQISLVSGEDRPRLPTGLDKLVQQVLFLLLTEVDSIEGLPGVGASPFSAMTTLCIEGDLTEVNSIVGEAAENIRKQLSVLQSPSSQDDERLGALDLQAVDYDRNSGDLVIEISIQSAAGDSAVYKLRG